MDENELMTVSDVAKMTHTAIGTLHFWRSKGQGPPAAKFGKRLVYRRADVQAWIDAQFEQAAAATSSR